MNTRIARFPGEHRYYVAAAIGIIIVVLAGFSIDIPLLSHLSSVSVLVRVHGLIMLTWIALFFVQALLVARHRVDLHMRLGIFRCGARDCGRRYRYRNTDHSLPSRRPSHATRHISAAVSGLRIAQPVYVRRAGRRRAHFAQAAQRLAQATDAAGHASAAGCRVGALYQRLHVVDGGFVDRAQLVCAHLYCRGYVPPSLPASCVRDRRGAGVCEPLRRDLGGKHLPHGRSSQAGS